MKQQITTYYIPNNPKILKGRIYTLYINSNNNLDLTSIKNIRNINISDNQNTTITITEKEYTRLLELNNIAYQLNTKRTTDIQNFLNEETKTLEELTKINTERQEIIKKLTNKKEKK